MSKPELPSLSPIPADPTVEQLLAAVAERDAVIAGLVGRMEDLEARVGQNSRNSSRPPSSDGYSKPRSPSRAEQKAAGRKPGKQPGAPGTHLRQVETPDEVVAHSPPGCRGCEAPLAGAQVAGVERRQVFDLPPSRLHVVEHQLQRRRCGCGTINTARAPDRVGAPAVYGPRLRAVAVYFLHVQHLPLARTAALLGEVYGVDVSEGFLTGLLAQAGAQTGQFLDHVRSALLDAEVAHYDETGVRVDGALQCEYDNPIWPHCDALIWPHLRHRVRARHASSTAAVQRGSGRVVRWGRLLSGRGWCGAGRSWCRC